MSLACPPQGIDLTAANIAVFVELPPDVGWCRQAEDRLHRRGQAASVTCYYLVARTLHAGAASSELARDACVLARYDLQRWETLNDDLEDLSGVTDGAARVSRLHLDREVCWSAKGGVEGGEGTLAGGSGEGRRKGEEEEGRDVGNGAEQDHGGVRREDYVKGERAEECEDEDEETKAALEAEEEEVELVGVRRGDESAVTS